MLRSIVTLLTIIVSVGAAEAQLFSDRNGGVERPYSYDCGALAAEIGPNAVWFGRFAGSLRKRLWDATFPYNDQGCFPSEYECRRWQHQNMSFLAGGTTLHTSCRQGLPR